jgi:hypothetical protein
MHDTDPFTPERWEMQDIPGPTPGARKKRPTKHRRSGRFLKGPIPWPWLVRAMTLPGKALAVGLILWLQVGITGRRTVHFCLAHAAVEGIPTTTARRAIRQLEQAGLVAIRRKPGRGLEVTLLDEPGNNPSRRATEIDKTAMPCDN